MRKDVPEGLVADEYPNFNKLVEFVHGLEDACGQPSIGMLASLMHELLPTMLLATDQLREQNMHVEQEVEVDTGDGDYHAVYRETYTAGFYEFVIEIDEYEDEPEGPTGPTLDIRVLHEDKELLHTTEHELNRGIFVTFSNSDLPEDAFAMQCWLRQLLSPMMRTKEHRASYNKPARQPDLSAEPAPAGAEGFIHMAMRMAAYQAIVGALLYAAGEMG